MASYELKSKLNLEGPHALVVHCGDHRFQAGFHEFLSEVLQLNANYDLMVIPGGPQTLTQIEHLTKFYWTTWKWLRFFVKMHHIQRLILIQHQDCGWYKAVVHADPAAEARRRQEENLRQAQQELNRDFPKLNVELYYAGWNENEVIKIEPVL
jgi:hypothetical protein